MPDISRRPIYRADSEFPSFLPQGCAMTVPATNKSSGKWQRVIGVVNELIFNDVHRGMERLFAPRWLRWLPLWPYSTMFSKAIARARHID